MTVVIIRVILKLILKKLAGKALIGFFFSMWKAVLDAVMDIQVSSGAN